MTKLIYDLFVQEGMADLALTLDDTDHVSEHWIHAGTGSYHHMGTLGEPGRKTI